MSDRDLITIELLNKQGSEYARDRKGSEYVWVCSWIMLK